LENQLLTACIELETVLFVGFLHHLGLLDAAAFANSMQFYFLRLLLRNKHHELQILAEGQPHPSFLMGRNYHLDFTAKDQLPHVV
jgi:hypothetical protein